MNEACLRWTEISDREAIGDVVTADDVAFAREHLATCAACRAEAGVWNEMASLVDDTRAGRRDSHVGRVLEPAEVRVEGLPLEKRGWLGVAAALAVAAAVAIFAFRSSPAPVVVAPPAPVPPAASPVDHRAVLADATGVEVDGRAATAGQELRSGALLFAREGSACVTIDPSVRACLARGSLVRVTNLGSDRRLELLGGRVTCELEKQEPGTSFGVTTRDGSAVAIGTAFSVEVPPGDAPVITRVLHGTVVVRGALGGEQNVAAHEQASMRELRPLALPLADETTDRALLDGTAAETPHPPVPPAAKSAGELLVAARERAAAGDRAGADAAYRDLFRHHAGSPEAIAALVPYGDLELASGDAASALDAFHAYLSHGGPLAEEASFGEVRALRALGRSADERRAIEAFVLRYPNGVATASLQKRLTALSP